VAARAGGEEGGLDVEGGVGGGGGGEDEFSSLDFRFLIEEGC
jgi:hypothetical protein